MDNRDLMPDYSVPAYDPEENKSERFDLNK